MRFENTLQRLFRLKFIFKPRFNFRFFKMKMAPEVPVQYRQSWPGKEIPVRVLHAISLRPEIFKYALFIIF